MLRGSRCLFLFAMTMALMPRFNAITVPVIAGVLMKMENPSLELQYDTTGLIVNEVRHEMKHYNWTKIL